MNKIKGLKDFPDIVKSRNILYSFNLVILSKEYYVKEASGSVIRRPGVIVMNKIKGLKDFPDIVKSRNILYSFNLVILSKEYYVKEAGGSVIRRCLA